MGQVGADHSYHRSVKADVAVIVKVGVLGYCPRHLQHQPHPAFLLPLAIGVISSPLANNRSMFNWSVVNWTKERSLGSEGVVPSLGCSSNPPSIAVMLSDNFGWFIVFLFFYTRAHAELALFDYHFPLWLLRMTACMHDPPCTHGSPHVVLCRWSPLLSRSVPRPSS